MHFTLLGLLLLFSPSVASAAPRTFSELVNLLVDIMNNGVFALIALAIAAYFFGMSTNILNMGEEPETRKRFFLWGIIILFFMVSIWGILEMVQGTLFGGDGFNTQNASGGILCDSFGNCSIE